MSMPKTDTNLIRSYFRFHLMLSLNKNHFPIFSYSENYNVMTYIFSTRLNNKNIICGLTIFNGDMWIVKCSERQMLERNDPLALTRHYRYIVINIV